MATADDAVAEVVIQGCRKRRLKVAWALARVTARRRSWGLGSPVLVTIKQSSGNGGCEAADTLVPKPLLSRGVVPASVGSARQAHGGAVLRRGVASTRKGQSWLPRWQKTRRPGGWRKL